MLSYPKINVFDRITTKQFKLICFTDGIKYLTFRLLSFRIRYINVFTEKSFFNNAKQIKEKYKIKCFNNSYLNVFDRLKSYWKQLLELYKLYEATVGRVYKNLNCPSNLTFAYVCNRISYFRSLKN